MISKDELANEVIAQVMKDDLFSNGLA